MTDRVNPMIFVDIPATDPEAMSTFYQELFGWQVNNRRDEAADFFPAGRFRSTYYRPDVIARVLDSGDELQALARANDQSGRNDRQISIRKGGWGYRRGRGM